MGWDVASCVLILSAILAAVFSFVRSLEFVCSSKTLCAVDGTTLTVIKQLTLAVATIGPKPTRRGGQGPGGSRSALGSAHAAPKRRG